MNRMLKLACSFVLGAIATVAVVYIYTRATALSNLETIACSIGQNQCIGISDFAVKLINSDARQKTDRKTAGESTRTVKLQWRCQVHNNCAEAQRYTIRLSFLDRDGFVLATDNLDSNYGDHDLPPSQTHTPHSDLLVPYSQAKHIQSCKIEVQNPKTNQQLDDERRQQQLSSNLQRMRYVEGVKARWAQLRKGMTKAEAEAILGKPVSTQSSSGIDSWNYQPGYVLFSQDGSLYSWASP